MSVRNLIAASLTGAALVAATPEPAAAQTTLDLETARDLVPTLVAVGQPAAAREMALALLARDPTNVPLLLALSRAENDLGNPEAAITAARAAFVASTTHRERYSASLLMAQALAANDQKFLAGIWLRRAADEATTEAERARAVRDYHVVSGQSALGIQIRGAVVPTDNVNNAPTTNRITIGGLTFIDPSALPISGIERRLGIDLSYRLSEDDTLRTTMILGADVLRVTLGQEAATIDPDLTADDLSRSGLRGGIGVEWAPAGATGSYRLDLMTSVDVADTTPVARSTWAEVRYRMPVRQSDAFWLGVGVRQTERLDDALRGYDQASLSMGYSRALAGGRQLNLSLRHAETVSDSYAVDGAETVVGAGLDLGEGWLGIGWSVSAELSQNQFDHALYAPQPRQDIGVELGLSAVIGSAAYMGFAPEITVDWTRVQSNIPSFDTRGFRIGIGVVSSF